jgi:O-antigen/teichoic acid export membrane protein
LDDLVSPITVCSDQRHADRAKRLGFSALLWQSATLITTLTTIILTLIIARVRGPDWFGDLSTYIFVSAVGATFGAMGIPNALSKYVSELEGNSQRKIAAKYARRQIAIVSRSGTIAGLVLLILMATVFLGKGYDDFASLAVIAISVPITVLSTAATQLSVGFQNFRSVLWASIVSRSFLIVIGLAVVLLMLPLFLYLSVVNVSLVIGIALQLKSSRIYDCNVESTVIPYDLESRAKGYSRALWVNTVLDLAVWTQSGTFFLWLLVGSDSAGQFSIAYTVTFTVISLLSGSITASLFPEFSRLYGAGDAPRGRETFRVGFKANALLVAPIASALVFGGTTLASVLFGARFDLAGEVIFILAISSGFVAIGALAASFGYAHEKHATWMKVSASMSILAIALFLVLVPILGLLGAVIVQSGVWVLSTCILYYLVRTVLRMQIPWRFGSIVVGSAAVSYAITYLAINPFLNGLLFLLVWGTLGTLVYFGFVFGLSRYDSDTCTILRTTKSMLFTIVGA